LHATYIAEHVTYVNSEQLDCAQFLLASAPCLWPVGAIGLKNRMRPLGRTPAHQVRKTADCQGRDAERYGGLLHGFAPGFTDGICAPTMESPRVLPMRIMVDDGFHCRDTHILGPPSIDVRDCPFSTETMDVQTSLFTSRSRKA
jgi:hypothetical protein